MSDDEHGDEAKLGRKSSRSFDGFLEILSGFSKPLLILLFGAMIVSAVAFKLGIGFWQAAALCATIFIFGGLVLTSDDPGETAITLGKPFAPVAGAAAIGFWVSSALGISFWTALAVAAFVVIGIVVLVMMVIGGGG